MKSLHNHLEKKIFFDPSILIEKHIIKDEIEKKFIKYIFLFNIQSN